MNSALFKRLLDRRPVVCRRPTVVGWRPRRCLVSRRYRWAAPPGLPPGLPPGPSPPGLSPPGVVAGWSAVGRRPLTPLARKQPGEGCSWNEPCEQYES